MKDNISYEVITLLILLLVTVQLNYRRKLLPMAKYKVFLSLLLVGVSDIVLDIVSSVFMCFPDIFPLWLQNASLMMFYILQLTMPFMFFIYELTLRGFYPKYHPVLTVVYSSPFILTILALFSNPITHCFYYDDGASIYHGVLFPVLYVHALFYVLAIVTDSLINRKKMNRRDSLLVREFMAINGIAVISQIFFSNILLTGVGIGVSLIILLITTNNPYERIDTLTGLFDQSALRDTIEEGKRQGLNYKLICISFKEIRTINRTFGVAEGNIQLRKLSDLLDASFGKEFAYRFVGDRFIVLMKSQEEYDNALFKIKNYFSEPHNIRGVDMRLKAYICGIPATETYHDTEELIDLSEYLMRKLSEEPERTFIEATKRNELSFSRRKEIEKYLFTAVQDSLLDVNLQPVFSIKDNAFVSAEALARLNHPVFGAISPDEFIHIAETAGLISELENCILRKVCLFLKENSFIIEKLRTVKLNISPASFLNISLAKNIIEVIKSFGLDPSFFQFEITESVAGQTNSNVSDWVDALKKSGAGLCLDDFGSGYANFDSVMKFPFDVIKFDRTMLLEALNNNSALEIYRGTSQIMQKLGYDIIAEGAETKADVEFLSDFGINYIQGFYYSRPLKLDAFKELISKQ